MSVGGPHTRTCAPSFCKQKILLRATRLWTMSPKMQTFLPARSPRRSRMEKASSKAWVGCSWVPSPALMIDALMLRLKKWWAPGAGWRITTMSTFIERILLTVSSSVSPFLTEELLAEKLTTSALRRFSASSKLIRVRVLFSKNKLATVTSFRLGTFFTGRLITCLNSSAISKMVRMSASVMYLMPSRCFVLSWVAATRSWFREERISARAEIGSRERPECGRIYSPTAVPARPGLRR